MIVEQALYGEVKGGHSLRVASGDRSLAIELAPRMDLPDNAPPGADWSPFVSGFPHRDRYVIARTFRDPTAARAGMVVSHALIAPLDSIVAVADLRPMFDHLIAEPAAPASLPPLTIVCDGLVPAAPELSAAAAALVTRGTGPVIRVGHHDFEPLITSLWARLWPAIRRGFAFRLSFGPGDLVESPQPALICTPASLVARWQGYRLLDRSANSATSLASVMLSGDGGGEPLRSFADSIGAELSSFAELPLLERAYRYVVLQPDRIDNTIAAVRLVERLSPQSSRGEVGKAKLLNRLILQLETAAGDDILPLRNLSLQGFAHADEVWAAIDRRVADNPFAESQDAAFCNVAREALNGEDPIETWRRAVLNGLVRAAERSEQFPSALWRWAKADPSLTQPLWTHLGVSKIEDRLVQVAPIEICRKAAGPIIAYAAEEKLYRLHGAATAAAYSPIEAIRLQVGAEPTSSSDGISIVLRHTTPSQLVGAAIEIGDVRLVPFAANAVAKKPALLAQTDISNTVARSVWSAAIAQSPDAWDGPAEPHAAFQQVLNDFLDGIEIPPDLVAGLANTPLGDLSSFARREELWSKLIGAARDHLLRATSAGWLNAAEAGRVQSPVETALSKAILDDPKLDTLLDRLGRNRIAKAVQVVDALPQFDEPRFRRWLRVASERTRPMSATDAEAIGRLTAERRWEGVADDLLGMLRWKREDVRPALRACVSLVSYLARWLYDLSPVTPAEKWDTLLELAARLYPAGPDHYGLWERAGGQDADLGWGGNGRSRWREALSRIRYGREPRIETLLHEMLKDYGANTELRFLADDREFGGNR